MFNQLIAREKERERERERQTDNRQRQRDRETETETKTERQREMEERIVRIILKCCFPMPVCRLYQNFKCTNDDICI